MRKLLIMAMLCLSVSGQAQLSAKELKPAKIGDSLPGSLLLTNIYNHPVSTLRLCQLKGKLVLFDFFSTSCGSCIRSLPHLDALQRKYKDVVAMYLVCYEPYSKIKKLAERKRMPANFSIPFITSDTTLEKLFPHTLLPHVSWVNQQGKVLGSTDAASVTKENIEAVLAGTSCNLPLKQDIIDYDVSRPLLEAGNGGTAGAGVYKSILTRYLPGMVSGSKIWTDSLQRKITWLNRPLLSLYQQALRFEPNRVVLEGDTTKYLQKQTTALYCYELTVPATVSDAAASKIMVDNLNTYLGLNGRLENRPQQCYVLRIADVSKIPVAKGGNHLVQVDTDAEKLLLLNQPISMLVMHLNNQVLSDKPKPIVVDETGYTNNINLVLSVSDLTNLAALNRTLLRAGLSLQPAQRSLDVFVLSK